MKTTIEISDPLFHAAKKAAEKQGLTLRALVELGLRQVLEAKKPAKPFRLRDASFRGKGLHPAVKHLSWEELRALSYEPEDP